MKKIFTGIMILSLVLSFIIYEPVKAKKLSDLKDELTEIERRYKENKDKQKMTEQEITTVRNRIREIQKQSNQIVLDMERLRIEIDNLNIEIKKSDQDIKNIINFYQVQNGEPAYLEYVTGAKSFTDFIYRFAISDQLTKYSDEQINNFNRMIEENKVKTKNLVDKKAELAANEIKLEEENKKLLGTLYDIKDKGMSIEEEIKTMKEMIKYYEGKGCKPSDNIETCIKNELPYGTAFYRPMDRGYITSEFGLRDLKINGSYDHRGIDISITPKENVSIYSSAPGTVAAVSIPATSGEPQCGGRMVFINHQINGQSYTTAYMHLMNIYVRVGQIVDANTVIATMGGGPNTWGWDTCSTGAHLHFAMATGFYGSGITNRYFNPRNMVNFPTSHSVTFTNKTTRYN